MAAVRHASLAFAVIDISSGGLFVRREVWRRFVMLHSHFLRLLLLLLLLWVWSYAPRLGIPSSEGRRVLGPYPVSLHGGEPMWLDEDKKRGQPGRSPTAPEFSVYLQVEGELLVALVIG